LLRKETPYKRKAASGRTDTSDAAKAQSQNAKSSQLGKEGNKYGKKGAIGTL